MARFKGKVQGNRGAASHLGHNNRGLRVEANGWSAGVTVVASVDHEDNDIFQIYRTGGSSGDGGMSLIGTIEGGEFHSGH